MQLEAISYSTHVKRKEIYEHAFMSDKKKKKLNFKKNKLCACQNVSLYDDS